MAQCQKHKGKCPKPSVLWMAIKSGVALTWAMPWTAVALVLFCSVIGVPFGLIALTIGCWPFKRVQMTYVKKRTHWEMRDQPLFSRKQRRRPWEDGE